MNLDVRTRNVWLHLKWQSLLCNWKRKSKSVWLDKACKISGASTEKDWQKGKERNKYFFLREHTNNLKSWQWKRACTSFWTAAQWRLSQWAFPPRQMEDFTTRVCARERNMLTFLRETCLGWSRCRLARWHQGGTPIPHKSAWISLKISEGRGKPRMISHQFIVAFQKVHVSDVPPHFPHPKPQVSSEIWETNREPLRESLCISVTGCSKRERKRKNKKLRKHQKSSIHQLRKRGNLGRKAPSP